ncbi:MAG TPA: helix-turn-helix transcriptional regulator [Bryobacteraceae bacterium]|nr:helix-turn-helix transcriptional regulator [Bryobacteraceae bacterium]
MAVAGYAALDDFHESKLAARTGMSTSNISALETGPKNVELTMLIRIAAS